MESKIGPDPASDSSTLVGTSIIYSTILSQALMKERANIAVNKPNKLIPGHLQASKVIVGLCLSEIPVSDSKC